MQNQVENKHKTAEPAQMARFTLETVANAVVKATEQAQQQYDCPVLCAGGVMASDVIRARMQRGVRRAVSFAEPVLSGDNAVGVAVLAARLYERNKAVSTVYSVTRLNNEIKELLDAVPGYRNLLVQGEISNYKAHSSGHHYMTLKDEGAAINAVMFRSDAMRLKFRLENGMKVIVRARVSSFPRTGQVQLYISEVIPDGAGALNLAFEQLKNKLQAEGLFDPAHKKPIPACPQRIALVTSPTGAAVRDMIRILGRRWPLARVTLYPAQVQGQGAAESIARALMLANAIGEADVILCGRGGGSMEDLWAFNEEAVARAIYDSEIPVISAVGHEPDVTIADFVADLRAPTPSGAAELAVPDRAELCAVCPRAGYPSAHGGA